MAKYYYNYDEKNNDFLEDCKLMKSYGKEIKLGSINCISCGYGRGHDSEEKWIKCVKLDEALNGLGMETFCQKVIKQMDCPDEFIRLVNKKFWELLEE